MKSPHQMDDDEGKIPGLASLRNVDPPPSLVPAVMRRIAEPAPPSLWRWLTSPRRFELRLSPAMLLAFSGIGVLVLVALRLGPARDHAPVATVNDARPAAALAQATPEVVQVRFVFFAPGAKKVSLVGDFNEWSAEGTVLEPVDGQGTFTATLPLRRGTHEYMFNVDGRWVTDPAASERRPDGFGRENGVLRL